RRLGGAQRVDGLGQGAANGDRRIVVTTVAGDSEVGQVARRGEIRLDDRDADVTGEVTQGQGEAGSGDAGEQLADEWLFDRVHGDGGRRRARSILQISRVVLDD